jgi:pimeloyl-ACP methyl ester carboxylesterase
MSEDKIGPATSLSEFSYVISARDLKSKTQFGSEVGVPRFLKVPNGERYSPKHGIKADTWLKTVRDLADGVADGLSGPNGDVLVFVHGYNNSLEEIAKRHRILQQDLVRENWQGVVVSFDWPCADSTLNYYEDRADAAASAKFLVTHGVNLIIKGQLKNGCETNIHLLGHSTGAFVIMEAFSAAQKEGDLYHAPWRVGQVAFIGGDVSRDSLDATSDWGKPLFDRIMRLTNYSNGFDDVLAISNAKRLGTAPRVGRVGLSESANLKAVNVNCSDYFHNLDPDKQTDKVGWWNHSWHIGNQVWTRDLAMTMEGRYDRSVIPTRENRPDGLYLRPEGGTRPQFESQWRNLSAPVERRLRPRNG